MVIITTPITYQMKVEELSLSGNIMLPLLSYTKLANLICIPGGHQFYLTAIYASNNPRERTDLWCDLINIQQSICNGPHPWLLAVDFNQIIHPDEHSTAYVNHLSLEMVELRDCFLQIDISHLIFYGSSHTWTNKQPDDPTAKKLYRLLVDFSWLTYYPHSLATFLAP